MPSVTIANGNVSSLMIGFRIVFSTPNTAAAMMTAHAEPWNVTPLSSQPVTASTSAFNAHETTIDLITEHTW
jgi:hypothetical protein